MMEYINTANDFLIETFGPLGPLYAIGVLGVLMVLLTLPMFLGQPKDPLDKLKQNQHNTGTLDDGQSLRHGNATAEKFDKYSKFLEPEDEGEYDATRLKLLQAGYRSKSAVQSVNLARFPGSTCARSLRSRARIRATTSLGSKGLMM